MFQSKNAPIAMRIILFCLLLDLRRRALIVRAWAELLALYVQGALPR